MRTPREGVTALCSTRIIVIAARNDTDASQARGARIIGARVQIIAQQPWPGHAAAEQAGVRNFLVLPGG